MRTKLTTIFCGLAVLATSACAQMPVLLLDQQQRSGALQAAGSGTPEAQLEELLRCRPGVPNVSAKATQLFKSMGLRAVEDGFRAPSNKKVMIFGEELFAATNRGIGLSQGVSVILKTKRFKPLAKAMGMQSREFSHEDEGIDSYNKMTSQNTKLRVADQIGIMVSPGKTVIGVEVSCTLGATQ